HHDAAEHDARAAVRVHRHHDLRHHAAGLLGRHVEGDPSTGRRALLLLRGRGRLLRRLRGLDLALDPALPLGLAALALHLRRVAIVTATHAFAPWWAASCVADAPSSSAAHA